MNITEIRHLIVDCEDLSTSQKKNIDDYLLLIKRNPQTSWTFISKVIFGLCCFIAGASVGGILL